MTKQKTLRELVVGAVEGFLITKTKFSVYDITLSIRQLVNDGSIEIPELRVTGQAFDYDIKHVDVRNIFLELNSNEEFSQALVRSFNGMYYVYEGSGQAPSSVGAIFSTMANTLGQMRNTSTAKIPSASATVQSVANGKLIYSEVVERVRTFFNNHKHANRRPTGKQIQSAIKRGNKSTGWSRAELLGIYDGVSQGTL
jgi:hypothetical protein